MCFKDLNQVGINRNLYSTYIFHKLITFCFRNVLQKIYWTKLWSHTHIAINRIKFISKSNWNCHKRKWSYFTFGLKIGPPLVAIRFNRVVCGCDFFDAPLHAETSYSGIDCKTIAQYRLYYAHIKYDRDTTLVLKQIRHNPLSTIKHIYTWRRHNARPDRKRKFISIIAKW